MRRIEGSIFNTVGRAHVPGMQPRSSGPFSSRENRLGDYVAWDVALSHLDSLSNAIVIVFVCDFQVSHLDMTIKESRNEQQQKIVALDQALNQARYQLSERAVEVRHIQIILETHRLM